MIDVRATAGGATLRVRVSPRAPRDELAGERDGALVVRVTAPPLEGEANAAVVRLLARRLGLAPSRGRDKVVLLAGIDPEDLRERLAGGR